MFSVDSAFASLAEDEGPLDLSPEAYVSTVVGDFSLTVSHSGRTGKAVEYGINEEWAGAPRQEEALTKGEERNGDFDNNLCKIAVNLLAAVSLVCMLSMSSNLLSCLKNW